MKLHPLRDCMRRADELAACGADVFQTFLCARCGAKNMIDETNTFYSHGICERCGRVTDIETSGCNYAIHIATGRGVG